MTDKRRTNKHRRSHDDPPPSKSTIPRSSSAVSGRSPGSPGAALGRPLSSSTPRSSLNALRPESLKLLKLSHTRASRESLSPASSFLSIDSLSSSSSKLEVSSPIGSPRLGRKSSRQSSYLGSRSSNLGNLSQQSSLTGSRSDVSKSPCCSVDVEKASCFIRDWYVNYATDKYLTLLYIRGMLTAERVCVYTLFTVVWLVFQVFLPHWWT